MWIMFELSESRHIHPRKYTAHVKTNNNDKEFAESLAESDG